MKGHGSSATDLDPWIAKTRVCGAPAIATFASGLDGDATAVKAALTEPRSSGQAEGQINRLKLIKRQSYGRAGLVLLQRRMVLATRFTQSEEEPQKRGNPNSVAQWVTSQRRSAIKQIGNSDANALHLWLHNRPIAGSEKKSKFPTPSLIR
ncbi:transposase [Methylobacterium sp. WL64]|nr:transposase [Methylobacterium sp. WL64]